MSQEKTSLLPTAIVIDNNNSSGNNSPGVSDKIGYQPLPGNEPGSGIDGDGIRQSFILYPGLEFDPHRKHTYGYASLIASFLILASWFIIETRTCYWGPGLNFERLQALHIAIMIFAFILFLLSLFGFNDFIFQFRLFFFISVLVIYVAVALQIWAVYIAATSPCKPFPFENSSLDLYPKSNVFNAGDGWGIVILFLDIFAALLLVSAASSFHKRECY